MRMGIMVGVGDKQGRKRKTAEVQKKGKKKWTQSK